MFRIASGRLVQWHTGRVSHETKIGRLAKLFRTEILGKDKCYNFQAFGDTLIGKTVKAISIAQSSSFDDLEPLNSPSKRIIFTPTLFDTPEKARATVTSVRFAICPGERAEPSKDLDIIRVASTTDPARLGKRIHELYLKNRDQMTLRCTGTQQAATAVAAMATFNEKVESHKLQSFLSNEMVEDEFRGADRNIRAVLFHLQVVPTSEIEFPE